MAMFIYRAKCYDLRSLSSVCIFNPTLYLHIYHLKPFKYGHLPVLVNCMRYIMPLKITHVTPLLVDGSCAHFGMPYDPFVGSQAYEQCKNFLITLLAPLLSSFTIWIWLPPSSCKLYEKEILWPMTHWLGDGSYAHLLMALLAPQLSS